MTNNVEHLHNFLRNLQTRLTAALQAEEPTASFHTDKWQRDAIGSGITCVIEKGAVLEKAGVNFSHVIGASLPPAATEKRPELVGATFEALGISSVIHPYNPFAPTAHMNVRYFEATQKNGEKIGWFGGGYDLTPYYGFEEDCRHFHQNAKKACDAIHPNFYPTFKKNADDYFYLKHRNEHRGIGGLFFDDLNTLSFEENFQFLQNVGNSFIDAYLPILTKRKDHPFTEKQREFQCYRRGRYVEFNLIYDRGTLFGLQFGGRTESILMSLPPVVEWKYDFHPEKNSEEEKLQTYFLTPKEWA